MNGDVGRLLVMKNKEKEGREKIMKKESWSSFHSACGRYGKIGMEDGAGRWWSVWERK